MTNKEKYQAYGAPEGNNLEPFSAPELLEQLENWADILKAEPEVIHRLEKIAAHDHEEEVEGDAVRHTPAPEEPSP
ncbi:hypothetical protein [Tateyamaria sp. ANG-S1]|uniref:hypothetical protein n=1 Tax=Tateyamaria sp. ANG-S1 TaxID=1577905 RepID=UPI00126A126D|nr:hypothetical protein [Tateyamaria sp. ANG-S1]